MTKEKKLKKILGKIICWLFGHADHDMYIVGMETWCPRCGRKATP